MELKKHPSLIFADEFQSLCQPLFNLGIDYFSHIRIKGNCLTANGSNPDYFRLYFEKEFQHFDIHAADFSIPQRYILWDEIEKRGKGLDLYQMEKEFGIDHVFTIVDQIQKEEKNYYCFGVHPTKKHMNEFYFRHLDLLEHFVSYYKNALLLNNQLNQAHSITCTFEACPDSYLINYGGSLSPQMIQDYLYSLKVCGQHLSKRESQCLNLTIRGHCAREAGRILGLSQRTVEEYLNNIKLKVGASSKAQLIDMAVNHFIRNENILIP